MTIYGKGGYRSWGANGYFTPGFSTDKTSIFVPNLFPLCDTSTQMLISQEPWVVPEYLYGENKNRNRRKF